LPTRCLVDSDGQRRCLRGCAAPGSGGDTQCGTGYLCAETATSTPAARDFRCMRSPLDVGLIADCMKHVQRYRVRVGDAFSVVGSLPGFIAEVEPNAATRECQVPPLSLERVRLSSSRLPLDPPLCPQQLGGAVD